MPSAVHLFLEECQEFVPQNPQKGEEQMLHAFVRMQKLGRNFGIGSSYITQRPQEVNKKALNMAQTLFVFRTTGLHERKAIEQWIEDKSLDQSIAQDLPKIATGNCHVWSPEFLKISEMVKISEKTTFDASATPEVGASAKSRKLADIDINKIRKEMEATIEKAKSEDPKELRKEIASLKKMLVAKNGTLIEKQVPDQRAIILAVEANNKDWQRRTQILVQENLGFKKILQKIGKLTYDFSGDDIMPGLAPAELIPKKGVTVYPNTENAVIAVPAPLEDAARKEVGLDERPLSKPARSIHDYLSSVYPKEKSKTQMWVATGYAPSGAFNNAIYELTGKRLIVKNDTKYRALVSTGVSFTPNLSIWDGKLSKPSRMIFHFMLENEFDSFSKEDLAAQTQYQLSGAFNNAIYELTGKELIIKEGARYTINPEILDL